MARPSVCRWEFQQVESEYIKTKAECGHHFDRTRLGEFKGLQIRVTRGQHGGEAGRFHLATATFTRLFKVPVIAHDLQRPFTVDFLFQSPQGFFDWLAFFQFNFGQINSHPLQRPWNRRAGWPFGPLQSGQGGYFHVSHVSIDKMSIFSRANLTTILEYWACAGARQNKSKAQPVVGSEENCPARPGTERGLLPLLPSAGG